MNYPNYFADADSNFNDSDYVIFGIPYDKTSSFRFGANLAPKKIRESSWNFETYNLRNKVDFKDINVHDFGDISIKKDSPDEVINKVKIFTSSLLKNNKFPVALGGDHSITAGLINAFEDEIAVLSLDAHLDYRDEYENEKNNHACVIRRISEKIDINDIAILGVRSAEKREFQEAKKDGLFWMGSYYINKNGIKQSLNRIKNKFRNKNIYITLDIDVLDPSFASGTSNPEPFGISPFDILECIEFFSKDIIGFDVMEVCPPYDHGETAILAAKFVKTVIEENWLKNRID
ncbi:agmatinase [Thermoplasmatota archaeon]